MLPTCELYIYLVHTNTHGILMYIFSWCLSHSSLCPCCAIFVSRLCFCTLDNSIRVVLSVAQGRGYSSLNSSPRPVPWFLSFPNTMVSFRRQSGIEASSYLSVQCKTSFFIKSQHMKNSKNLLNESVAKKQGKNYFPKLAFIKKWQKSTNII